MTFTTEELDLCFVEATDLIRKAVGHVTQLESCDGKLAKELLQWQSVLAEGDEEDKQQPLMIGYCRERTSIPFDLVLKVHQLLRDDPLGE